MVKGTRARSSRAVGGRNGPETGSRGKHPEETEVLVDFERWVSPGGNPDHLLRDPRMGPGFRGWAFERFTLVLLPPLKVSVCAAQDSDCDDDINGHHFSREESDCC